MNTLEKELRASGWIHRPLPLHEERSLEAEGRAKPVLESRPLSLALDNWLPLGGCQVSREGGRLTLSAPLCHQRRPQGDLERGDCSHYGSFGAACRLEGENWEAYNRLSLWVKAEALGVRKVCARLCLRNDGKVKLPDPYDRDGFHTVNLSLGREERISLEIPNMPRDCMTGLEIQFNACGCETEASLGNRLTAQVWDLALERVAATEVDIGWKPDARRIVHCFAGYTPYAQKIALALGRAGEPFQVLDDDGKPALEGRLESTGFHGLSRMDFTALQTEGMYRISLADRVSARFEIGPNVWLSSAWKVINFLFCQRCGYPVPGVHQTCHSDVVAKHAGKSLIFHGGWHDAGDLSQQLIQSAEVTESLFELAQALPKEQEDLKIRLREEALWGLDYVLKSRFGDGYRATSVGIAMWSQGFMGDADDITARLHNNAYENFLCAGVECYCAMQLTQDDPGLAQIALRCAQADFAFAQERFAQTGFDERPPIYWEHSWMTPESAFCATMARAAALLYEATSEERYRDAVEEGMAYVLSCQHAQPAGPHFDMGGFFYRNPQRKAIVHFSHQARDQIFAQALTAALRALPDHPQARQWRDALRRHAAYLRGLMAFASPYGMVPAGLYRLEEREDAESFARQHLETGPEAYEHYAKQLEAGTAVGDGYYLRQFPVWFSFKGNNAVLLSMGKAMALCGRALGDASLLDAAQRQLAWNLGVNPFCQSLMYGEGERYAQQYAAMSGEATGELPVGVQTRDDEDEPYWPQMNNATYKEVWTTPAGRWLSLLADLVLGM